MHTYMRTWISLWVHACTNTQLDLKKKIALKPFFFNARESEIFSRLDCKVIKVSRIELAQGPAATQANCILLHK